MAPPSRRPKPRDTALVRGRPAVALRTAKGVSFEVPPERLRGLDARYWAYVARSRSRWAGEQQGGEVEAMTELLGEDALRELAASRVVEVDIPFESESASWAARVVPWEYLLSKGTKPHRKDPLVVVRQLRVTGAEAPPPARRSIALVESAPVGLDKFFDLDLETQCLAASLGAGSGLVRVHNPTRETLAAALREAQPELVHLAGADTHRAVELLGLSKRPTANADPAAFRDGFALAGANGGPDFVDADSLAAVVCGAAHRPALVSCSFFNSASRVAPLLVAAGAGAAVGFQDTIARDLGVTFYACFYRELRLHKRPMLEAFVAALDALRREPGKLEGACVVLWSAQPLLPPGLETRVGHRLPKGVAHGAVRGSRGPAPDRRPAKERLKAEIAPLRALSYSLLQNSRSLFETFTLWNLSEEALADVDVEVTLHVGVETCRFEKRLELLPARPHDLTSDISVPLTAALLRTPTERLATVLSVKVRLEGEEIVKDSFPVRLNPADEWTDTERDRQWLPCFVLPGDPAVRRVVDAAQRYLAAIADDPAAGFDGYQQLEEGSEEADLVPVDLQARALWSALLFEFPLSYINPPPSYTAAAQRLRVPSRILAEHRGTCIDLALLFAACLEYVGIYPVIFLLEGHVFPGYWRSERAHADVRRMEKVFLPADGGEETEGRVGTQEAPTGNTFILGRDDFYQVRELVRLGLVAPVETVALTGRRAFADALQEGRANLRSRAEFEAMIDVAWAREQDVLPLPLLGKAE